jgi:uncharacterized paraquat-inducible protein A
MTGNTDAPRWPTGVVVAAIVCGTLVMLALIAVMGYLIDRGRDTAALMTFVTATIVPLISAVVLVRVERVGGTVETVRQQTNGAQSRLYDMLERLQRQNGPAGAPTAPQEPEQRAA